MDTLTVATDAASIPAAVTPPIPSPATPPPVEPQKRAPKHSALTVLGKALRLRDQYEGVQDPRVNEDLGLLAAAIVAVEKVSRSMPALKATAAEAKAHQQEQLRAVKGRVLMVTTALKLRPGGAAIIASCHDSLAWIFAEMLVTSIPANFLGDDQVLVRELEKDTKRLHQATEALADKQGAVDEAAGRYKGAVRELNLAISQLLASARGYQARQKRSA